MTSKYDRLGDGSPLGSIAAIGAATIILTFAEIEAVVGPPPTVARRDPGWWGATTSGRYFFAHALHWERVGYTASVPDLAAETVTFRRVKP